MIYNFNGYNIITYPKKHLRTYYLKTFSGHLFELLDYYYIFKINNKKVKCLIPEDCDINYFKNIIYTRYNEKYTSVFDINDFIFDYDYKLVRCKNVLLCDGCFTFLKSARNYFLCENIFAFACGDAFFNKHFAPKNAIILADHKVYGDFGVNYVKKVLPHLRKSQKTMDEFAHVTKNCKMMDIDLYNRLIKKYPNITIYSDYIFEKNTTNKPVLNFSFSKFIYTPVPRKFDCSPRLIIECQILGIPFEFFEINYSDPGLERRMEDYDKFILHDNDEILNLIK